MTYNTALNTILQGEAQKALDATWESGSFLGHSTNEVQLHWYEVNFILELAEERGLDERAAECRERLAQIERFMEIANS